MGPGRRRVTYEALGAGAEDPLGGAPPMHTLPNPYHPNGGLKSLTIRNAPMGNSSQACSAV